MGRSLRAAQHYFLGLINTIHLRARKILFTYTFVAEKLPSSLKKKCAISIHKVCEPYRNYVATDVCIQPQGTLYAVGLSASQNSAESERKKILSPRLTVCAIKFRWKIGTNSFFTVKISLNFCKKTLLLNRAKGSFLGAWNTVCESWI